MVFHHFCTLRDIRHHAAVPVAHGLQQAQRHPLQIGRQHIEISVAVQLVQQLSLDKTGKYDPVVSLGQRFQLPDIFYRIRRASGDDQLLIRPDLPVCLDQIADPLLLREPRQKEDIVSAVQAVPFTDQMRLRMFRTGHPVGDEPGLPSVGIPEIILDPPAQDDDLVRELYGAFFSHHNVGTGQPPPFGPLVVQPVDRGDAPFPEKLRQPEHGAGTLRMEMDHVVRAKRGEKSAEKGRRHGCQPFPLQRRYRLDPYLFVFFQTLYIILAAAHVVSTPVIAHDPVSARRQPRAQLFHHHLDPALPGRHPFVSHHGDPESLSVLLFFHSFHLHNLTCTFNR